MQANSLHVKTYLAINLIQILIGGQLFALKDWQKGQNPSVKNSRKPQHKSMYKHTPDTCFRSYMRSRRWYICSHLPCLSVLGWWVKHALRLKAYSSTGNCDASSGETHQGWRQGGVERRDRWDGSATPEPFLCCWRNMCRYLASPCGVTAGKTAPTGGGNGEVRSRC